MPCYLTVQDRNFKVIEANSRFIKHFGDYSDRYCYQVYKKRSEKCENCPVEKTFRDGRSYSSEENIKCLDGRVVSVIVYTTPIRNERGEITSVMEMSTDITDIKLLQNQLKESQIKYRTLFGEVPCYITTQDSELNIIEANRHFQEDFGSFFGCKCYGVYKGRQEECVVCPVQETFKDGKIHQSEEVVTSKNGKQKNVLVTSAPVFDYEGKISSVMEMSADITIIRELQSQLESIGLLISTISHDIKGLLNGLDGGIYLVNSGIQKNDNDRRTKGWKMVQRNIGGIRNMVLNILYYAKEREPNYEQISAIKLAEDVCKIMGFKSEELKINFVNDISTEAGDFLADSKAIQSLLVNLLENAFDACWVDQAKKNHCVKFSVKRDGEHIRFDISDTGIGMDKETKDKLFSLFFSSKGSKGTGLGLFIANKIACSHNGSIEVDSEVGRGTQFVVKIPKGP